MKLINETGEPLEMDEGETVHCHAEVVTKDSGKLVAVAITETY